MKDILNVVDKTDLQKKERIDFDDKKLDQMTLPERAHVLNEIMSYAQENEELNEDEKQVLDKVKLSIDQKILSWAWIVKNIQDAQELIDHENEHYKQKIEDNKKRSQVLQNRINSRMTYIGQLMHEQKLKKIEGFNYSVSLKKQADELVFDTDSSIIDWSKYPDELYDKIPESNKPKLAKLKTYLKNNKSDDFSMSSKPLRLVIK